MKGRQILIQEDPRYPGLADDDFHCFAAAYVVDGRVEDLLFDQRELDQAHAPSPGDLMIGQIERVLPNNGGAFARVSPNRTVFLRDGRHPKGGFVIVQAEGFAEPGKATPATSRILIKRRHIILIPGKPGVNVSRKISGQRLEDMAELREAIKAEVDRAAPGCGAIVRSEAWRISEAQMMAELASAIGQWSWVNARLEDPASPKPALLTGTDASTALIEHWGTPADDVEFLFAGPNASEAVALADIEPELEDQRGRSFHFDDGDMFDYFGVWAEVERLRSPRADLPSGGWMSIEATTAMVTVDVNTGDQFGGGAGMTANVEACRELPRQLRLRGLGGQVTIDFAPMKKMHRKKIDETLKTAFRRDPVATTLAGWTPLGNFELQRKRERRPLAEIL